MDKWFLRSKTVWGALVLGALPHLLVLAGMEPDPAQIAALKDSGEVFFASAWELFEAGSQIVGVFLVIFGRQRAAGKLTLLPSLDRNSK